jgi:hypothetical protein
LSRSWGAADAAEAGVEIAAAQKTLNGSLDMMWDGNLGRPCGMFTGGRARFGTVFADQVGPLPSKAEAIVMHWKSQARLVALVGGVLTMLASAAFSSLFDRSYSLDFFFDVELLVGAAVILGVLYALPLYPVVRSLAPKRVGAEWAFAFVVVLVAIFVPLLGLIVGPDLAFIQAPLLAWAVFSLGAIVLVQDVEVVRGVCSPCGYDLTGNQTGICPECGRPAGEPGHVSFARRWRGALPAQLERWAAAVAFSLLLAMTAPPALRGLSELMFNGGSALCCNLRSQLQTIRSQIELYNVQNPSDPYDADGAPAGFGGPGLVNFWDALVQGEYLQAEPINPHTPFPGGNNPTAVAAAAAANGAWVWAESNPGDRWTLNIYAIDEDGSLYSDPDTGQPY